MGRECAQVHRPYEGPKTITEVAPGARFFWRVSLRDTQRTPRCARDIRRAALKTSHALQPLPCNTEHGHVSTDRLISTAPVRLLRWRVPCLVSVCVLRRGARALACRHRAARAARPCRRASMSDQVTTLVTRARRSTHKRRYVHLRARPAPGPRAAARTDGDVHAHTHAAGHTRKTATKAAVGDGRVWDCYRVLVY